MKKRHVFLLGFAVGVIVGVVALLGWSISRLPKVFAHTPARFEDAILDRLPVDGEWLVVWGGEKRSENHHRFVPPQNLALDMVRTLAGSEQTFDGEKTKNESYACWAQPLFAPVDGTVEISVDGVPDNIPGEMNPHIVSGNCLMIRSKAGFLVVMAHLKNGSVAKKKGDVVKTGDFLGLCGNSGNSSEPHLHFHIQSEIGFVRGVALRPVFREVMVGGTILKNYSPKKNDRISDQTKGPTSRHSQLRGSSRLVLTESNSKCPIRTEKFYQARAAPILSVAEL